MQAPLKMKDLEAQTGVSREAIHFYLREGLLPEPQRLKPVNPCIDILAARMPVTCPCP